RDGAGARRCALARRGLRGARGRALSARRAARLGHALHARGAGGGGTRGGACAPGRPRAAAEARARGPEISVVAAGAVVAALGGLVAGLGVYQLVLAVAAFWYRPPRGAGEAGKRVGVLVPAHDEEASIARCVRSLLDQDYPRDLFDVIVIA